MMTTTYDAGDEREALARELAAWNATGWMESQRAWRWHRRVRILARVIGMPVDQVVGNLRQDAYVWAQDA